MNTAQAIEAITDAGMFEVLATRVLRNIDSDYFRFEHLGVNAEGKTIKNPLDGFSRVPDSSPSRYVMGAFSTDLASKIERKLLFDHTGSKGKSYTPADDGDLVKAIRSACKIRKDDPNAKFIFTFCTNKQPSEELMGKGYSFGDANGMEVRFLARSELRDHLDTTPEGQWLRKEHLEIDADLLSLPLLGELASDSLYRFSYELFCPSSTIIDTRTTRKLSHSVTDQPGKVHILRGPSGYGKSVSAFKLLRETLDNGGLGLWLDPELFIDCGSVEEALTKTLQSLSPSLGSEAGRDAITLTGNSQTPFVLVVDDVNRSKQPAKLAKKLLNWHRRLSGDPNGSTQSSQGREQMLPHLVIPIWDRYWSSFDRREEGFEEVVIQRMTPEEAGNCFRACSSLKLSDSESQVLLGRLRFDPILITLWSKMHEKNLNIETKFTPNALMRSYINDEINRRAESGEFIAADYRLLIKFLAKQMLNHREFRPSWEIVSDWLNPQQTEMLRELCTNESVCRSVRRDGVDRLEFRHDRLLEAVLSDRIQDLVKQFESHRDVISDPFLSTTVADALVTLQDAELVNNVGPLNPLALFESLRNIQEPNDECSVSIIRTCSRWLKESVHGNGVPKRMILAIARILESIQAPFILQLTESVKTIRTFSGPRLLNGDVKYGKMYVAHTNFFPGTHAPHIEQLLERALSIHREQFVFDLNQELRKEQCVEYELHAALILAGYIGDERLAEPALKSWERSGSGEAFLLETLWAVMRCTRKPEEILTPLFDWWGTLSDDEDPNGHSMRNSFVFELSSCMRHGIPDPVVHFVIKRAETDDRLSGLLLALLKQIDHPSAVVTVAKQIAVTEERLAGTGKWNPFSFLVRDNWDPIRRNKTQLSSESRAALLEAFRKCGNEPQQDSLFRSWIATTSTLQDFTPLTDSESNLEVSLRRRAELGDRSASGLVLRQLSKSFFWWHVVSESEIWDNRFCAPLDEALLNLAKNPDVWSNDTFTLSGVLRGIPSLYSKPLLVKHWEELKERPLFLQVALFIGDSELVSRVGEAINDAPADFDAFRHITSTFGFLITSRKKWIRRRHIEVLLPYISRICDSAIIDIAQWLAENGPETWLLDTVLPEIMNRVEKELPKGNESFIVRLQRVHFPTDQDLLRSLSVCLDDQGELWRFCHYAENREDSLKHVFYLLRQWFESEPSPDRLRVVSEITSECGRREDANKLEQYQEQFGDDLTAEAVRETTFAVQSRTFV